MAEPSIPADLAQFIRDHIDRLETLEVLLLLQATPTKVWSISEISDEMRSSVLTAETAVRTLVAHRLVSGEAGGYRFQPFSPELAQSCQHLSTFYRERRTTVITAIFSRPTDAVRSFADAFRIKKGPA